MHMDTQSVRKTYKYRLYPTPEQAQALDGVLWRCRTLYNVALEERKTAWERCSVSLRYHEQATELPGLKPACPEYTEAHSQVLQDVLRRLEKTYQAFFRRLRAGDKPGHPRYKARNCYRSFTYPQYGNGAVLDGGVLSLSTIGRLRIKLHRPLEGTPKTVTISREAHGWYACVSCAAVPVQPLPRTGQETGIDLGLESFATRADGQHVHNPRHLRTGQHYLCCCQRRVARRKPGSQRRRRAVVLLAKAHQHIAHQRRDFHHKEARKLVEQFDVMYYEDLQVKHLGRRPAPRPDGNGGYEHNGARAKAGLNTSIQDAGWSSFLTILAFKAASAGKRVVAVPPAYTSQDCSNVLADGTICGERVTKSLAVRMHVCPKCGLRLDRDENAARNILRRGQEQCYGQAGERGAGQGPSGTNVVHEGLRSLRSPRHQAWGACHDLMACPPDAFASSAY
jgi:putative transposase